MRNIFSLLMFLFSGAILNGQSYKEKFDQFCLDGDTLRQIQTLMEWETAEPEDPELYTSYFNYYITKSRKEVLAMTTAQPKGESLSIKDSSGNTAGYLEAELYYQQEILSRGIEKIDEGIRLYPDRLDMRFGKIYVLGETESWQEFTNEILKAVRYSDQNKNNWTWINNEKKENARDFFLSALQDYQLTLYNTGDDELLVNMRSIAEEILKYYPDHIESLSNLSITFLLTGEYDKGLEPLLMAEKIDPEDVVILGNIAYAYKLKGDIKNSVSYYKKVIEYGDESSAAFASSRSSK